MLGAGCAEYLQPGEVRQNGGWFKLEAAAGPSYASYHSGEDGVCQGGPTGDTCSATAWRAEIRAGFNEIKHRGLNVYLDPADLLFGGGGTSIEFAAIPTVQVDIAAWPDAIPLYFTGRVGLGFGKTSNEQDLHGDVVFGLRGGAGIKLQLHPWHAFVEYSYEGYFAPGFATALHNGLAGMGISLY